jgi:hypothetical protein
MNYQNILNFITPHKNSTKMIMAEAKAQHADLIVVAYDDRKDGKRVVEQLFKRAPCDILAIKGEEIL